MRTVTRRGELNRSCEVAHGRVAEPVVGRPGGGVEVVDVERDHRCRAGHHLLHHRCEHRRGEPLTAQAGGQPDPLQLGAPERERPDVGLEDDLTVLDDDVGVTAGDERGQRGAVAARGPRVGRVADLGGEHVDGSRQHEVELVRARRAHPVVQLDAEGRRWRGRREQRLVRADRPRRAPVRLQRAPQVDDLVAGPEQRGDPTAPAPILSANNRRFIDRPASLALPPYELSRPSSRTPSAASKEPFRTHSSRRAATNTCAAGLREQRSRASSTSARVRVLTGWRVRSTATA